MCERVRMCCEGAKDSMGNPVPSFAFSAQSTAGFLAFPGRDIVAMAIPEGGSP